MRRADSLEKTLMLGNTEGRRRGMAEDECLDSAAGSVDVNLSRLQEAVKERGTQRATDHGITESWT